MGINLVSIASKIYVEAPVFEVTGDIDPLDLVRSPLSGALL
jgi:hypothetical protein